MIKPKANHHYWAKSHYGDLVVVLCDLDEEGFEVCGAWEGGIGAKDIELIAEIPRPYGYEENPLMYEDKSYDS